MRSRLWIAIVVAASGCSPAPESRARPASSASDEVRITQFYAEPVVPKGEKTSLCYGVENAKSVQITPAVEEVWPSIARCFPISPTRATTYTLTAEDGRGHTATKSIEVKVGPPRAKIIEVSINKTEIAPGEQVVLCYKASNAISVEAGPGHFMTTRAPDHGCIGDRPAKTTTYHVKITSASGQTDSEQVTVRVNR